MDFKSLGTWAVIAGGSEGVGASFARRLAIAGMNLVLVARKPGPLAELAAEIRGLGVEVRTITADLATPDALAQIKPVTQGLDVGMLIVNAGSEPDYGDFVATSFDRAQYMINLNVATPMALVHHFGRPMRERGRGGIILLGSVTATVGIGGIAAYSATKAFIQTFAEGLWAEMRPHNVHVLGLVIGGTRTPSALKLLGPAHERGLADPNHLVDPDEIAKLGLDNLDKGPICQPAKVAERIRYFQSLPRTEAIQMLTDGIAKVLQAPK